MGIHRSAIEELGCDNPVVRRALDGYRYGYMDYETAMESAVLALVASNRELTNQCVNLLKTQPLHVVMPGAPCCTE
ncbi:hypothetical protein HPA02_08170 [Bisbaumannia pacifica]|uniref:Uncharacterized protein n=1 Tax=Bisbaumannia pacifica TaxID=77098 RepID=A0A510X532_9GAMM|nr:hypothetical protein HPA02_08170 [Halomonas pacifica]